MEWVFDNLENVIVPIIILILYGLGNAKGKKKKKGKARELARRAKEGAADEARRVRDIQEEIRRKIAERAGGTTAPPPPIEEEPPGWPSPHRKPIPAGREMEPPTRELPEPVPPPVVEPLPPPPLVIDPWETEVRLEDIEDNLENIEDRLRRVQELETDIRQREVEERAELAIAPPPVAPLRLAKDSLRGQLFRDLAHPHGQRKAILVSEILGRPLGIKGPVNLRARW